jgi:hypothetical protein
VTPYYKLMDLQCILLYNKIKIQEDSYLDPKVDLEPEVELL